MNYVGIDLHKKTIVLCVMNQDRKISHRRTFFCCEVEAIVAFFRELGPFQVAVEATASYEWLIELIEPLNGTAPLHAEPLPADGSFAMCFHHVAMRITGKLADYEAHMASLDPVEHPVAWSGGLADLMRYAYTDERRTLGHYVEHVWFDDDFYAQLASAIPVYPAQ